MHKILDPWDMVEIMEINRVPEKRENLIFVDPL